MNKKGLMLGLFALMIVLFIASIFSLMALYGWNTFNDAIQDTDNESIAPDVKEDIDNLSWLVNWNDKIFVLIFIVLMVSYLISSVTVPVDRPIFYIIFVFVLILFTTLAMFISNTWQYIISQPDFINAASQLSFTDWIMNYFPYVVFFIGISGGLLFYIRSRTQSTGGVDGFE